MAEPNQEPLTIKVGAYENQPKIYTTEAGEIVGLFPDILQDIAQKEGWQLQYVPGTWAQCLARLEKNEIDLMVDVAFSEKRARQYEFTNETFLVNWATIYTGSTQTIDNLLALKGKRVAVMRGSIHTDGDGGIRRLARTFDIKCSFVEVDSYQEVFELLASQQADAGVVNRIFGSLAAAEYGLQKTPIIFNPTPLKFALPKGAKLAPLLKERIDYHLREQKKDPDSLYHKALTVYLSGLPRHMIYKGSATANGSEQPLLTAKEEAWIREHPIIRLGVDPEFAPFEYFSEQGVYKGMAAAYVKILNRRLGLNLRVVQGLTWTETVRKAKVKEIDVLACVGITEDREKFLLFSSPYIQFHRVIITQTNTPFLTGLADLENMKVAVQKNSSHEGYLRENTNLTIVSYPTLQEALVAVSSGRTQALVGNIASATYWIRKLNLTNLKVAAPVSHQPQNLHFAVRDDWPELVRILNKGLAALSQEEKNEIQRQWVNVDYQPGLAPRVVWRHILQGAGVALLVLMVILFWNYRLQQEIQKRIVIDEKLSEANRRLKLLDQLKSMFIASMSHELRTPLNSIIGFTGIILQGMTGPLNDKQKDHLSRVYHSSKHLLALITDVIDISKIEAGRIDVFPEEFILSEVIEEAVINIEPQLQAKNLELEVLVPAGITLHTDRKRLLQCIINFLSNAVKFTEQGRITITASEGDELVEIWVKDTGIGISEQNQARLFEAFERLESHLRVKAGGTGLGLYLTRKIVIEALRGKILVSSQEGRGSSFGLIIPKTILPQDHPSELTGEEA